MYWPSFNGALARAGAQERCIVNTVFSLTGSCIFAAIMSRLAKHGKLDAEVVLNATLAGGVVIGAASDLIVSGWISLIIGSIGGTISALGFLYLGPYLQRAVGLHDTCGVNNLHGMPGLLGGIAGAISTSLSESIYGANLNKTFPMLAKGRTL